MAVGYKPKKQPDDIDRAREILKIMLAQHRTQEQSLKKYEQSLIKALELLGDSGSDCFTCPACDHFSEGFCRHYGDEIPDQVLAKGCDKWTEAIPF